MIRYTLVCEKGHSFESWFADSAAYEKQAKRKLVTCPSCDSSKVEKAIMAPNLGASAKSRKKTPDAPAAEAPVSATAPVAMLSPQEREL